MCEGGAKVRAGERASRERGRLVERVAQLGLVVVTLGLGVSGGVSRASAQAAPVAEPVDATDARARQHYEAGEAYFQEGDFEGAVREFRQAYSLSPRPGILHNLYVACERAGHVRLAIEYLEQYLDVLPADRERLPLEERLAELRARVATEGDSPEPSGATPSSPTEHGVEHGVSEIYVPGLVLAGVGLVALGVGGGLVVAEDGRLRGLCAPACPPSEVGTLEAASIVADVGIGAALVGAGLAAVGLLLERGSSEASRVSLGAGGLTVRFDVGGAS